ncbi:MAG: hypothetical protein JO054_12150, partial [Actinobacteria bacterium]|nr:hypothetical protein [Actinomycetota bacterium]
GFHDSTPTSPLSALTARVEGLDLSGLQPGAPVPQPGTVAEFSIVLSNPAPHDIRLDPCPTYTQGFGPGLMQVYRLNCDSIRLIPAHGEVRYQMRLRLTPGDLYMGFGWHLLGGPFAN